MKKLHKIVWCIAVIAGTMHAQKSNPLDAFEKSRQNKSHGIESICNTTCTTHQSSSAATHKALLFGALEGLTIIPSMVPSTYDNHESLQLYKEQKHKKSLRNYSARLAYMLKTIDLKEYKELKQLYHKLHTQWAYSIGSHANSKSLPLGTATQTMFLQKEIEDFKLSRKKQWSIVKNTIKKQPESLIQILNTKEREICEKKQTKLGNYHALYETLCECQAALFRDCKPPAVHTAQATALTQKVSRALSGLSTMFALCIALIYTSHPSRQA